MLTNMSAYLIVNYDVDDADAYAEYQKGAVPALKVGSDAKILVVDPESHVVEGGDTVGRQTVVLEYESVEKAKEVYESGEYQAVVGQRHAATSKHFAVIVNGFGT